jgi:hypothetical protein
MKFAEIVNLLSGLVVFGFCGFLIGLAVVIATKPLLAERFLRCFASSARTHYTEQSLRLLSGAALVTFANSMWYPRLIELFGWLLAVTAIGLILMPWRWHQQFAALAMPLVIRHMRLFALGAFALGGFILYCASRAVTS